MDYVVIIEKADDGSYSAYLPDLPGCVACGNTIEEAKQRIAEAMPLHLESLREHNEAVPLPSAEAIVVHAA